MSSKSIAERPKMGLILEGSEDVEIPVGWHIKDEWQRHDEEQSSRYKKEESGISDAWYILEEGSLSP